MKKIIIFIILFVLLFCCSEPYEKQAERITKDSALFQGYAIDTVGDSTDDWVLLTPNAQWEARESMQLFVPAKNKIWVFGGHNNNYLNDVWCSDTGEVWVRKKGVTTDSSCWSGRRSHGVFYDATSDYFYISGGLTVSGVIGRDVWKSRDGIDWDLVNGACSFGRRAGHGYLKFGNKQVILGGYCSNVSSTSFWDSDEVLSSTDNGNTWTVETNNPGWSGRRDHACIVFDGNIWVIGGLKNDGQGGIELCDDAWYSSDLVNWTQATANNIYERVRQSLAVIDGKLFMIGGYIGNDPIEWNDPDSPESSVSNEVFVYDGNSWDEIIDIPWGKRASLSAVNFGDHLIIMAGSQSCSNAWYNDVWKYIGD